MLANQELDYSAQIKAGMFDLGDGTFKADVENLAQVRSIVAFVDETQNKVRPVSGANDETFLLHEFTSADGSYYIG